MDGGMGRRKDGKRDRDGGTEGGEGRANGGICDTDSVVQRRSVERWIDRWIHRWTIHEIVQGRQTHA